MPTNSTLHWTRCPRGFVFPDNPSRTTNIFLGSSGCAATCRSPFSSTPDENLNYDNAYMIACSIGFSLIVPLFFVTLWRLKSQSRRARKSYLLMVLLIGLSTLTTIASSLSDFTRDKQAMFCVDNTTTRNQDTGPSLCTAQGVLFTYFPMAFVLSWLVQCFDIYTKIVLQKKIVEQNFPYFITLIFAYPSIPVVLIASANTFGFDGRGSSCLNVLPVYTRWHFDTLFYTFDMSMYICLVIGLGFLSSTLYCFFKALTRVSLEGGFGFRMREQAYQTAMISLGAVPQPSDSPSRIAPNLNDGMLNVVDGSGATFPVPDNNNTTTEGSAARLRRQMRAFATPIMACILFAAFFIISLVFNVQTQIGNEDMSSLNDVWSQCIVNSYDGVNDDSWVSLCGERPGISPGNNTPSSPVDYGFAAFISGQSIGVFLIYCKIVLFPERNSNHGTAPPPLLAKAGGGGAKTKKGRGRGRGRGHNNISLFLRFIESLLIILIGEPPAARARPQRGDGNRRNAQRQLNGSNVNNGNVNNVGGGIVAAVVAAIGGGQAEQPSPNTAAMEALGALVAYRATANYYNRKNDDDLIIGHIARGNIFYRKWLEYKYNIKLPSNGELNAEVEGQCQSASSVSAGRVSGVSGVAAVAAAAVGEDGGPGAGVWRLSRIARRSMMVNSNSNSNSNGIMMMRRSDGGGFSRGPRAASAAAVGVAVAVVAVSDTAAIAVAAAGAEVVSGEEAGTAKRRGGGGEGRSSSSSSCAQAASSVAAFADAAGAAQPPGTMPIEQQLQQEEENRGFNDVDEDNSNGFTRTL